MFEDRTLIEGWREKAFKLRPTDAPAVLNFKRKLRREAALWLQQSLPGGGADCPAQRPSFLTQDFLDATQHRARRTLQSRRLRHSPQLKCWSWNACTLQLGQLQEALRTAGGCQVDVVMIQSTRWTSPGPRLVEGFRVFYTDNSSGRQQKGALIAIRETTLLKGGAISSFDLVPGRALAVRVSGRHTDWTFLTAYAPVDVLATTLADREAFWKSLTRFTDNLPGRTTLIVGGDFNAHVGSTQDGVAGPCGQEAFTPNGEALCDWARSHSSFLPTTHLKGRPSGWTWQRSDGSVRHRLDYWTIPSSWRAFVFARGTGVVNANPMQGATKAIDHRLICLTLQGYPRLWEKYTPRPQRTSRAFQQSLMEKSTERLGALGRFWRKSVRPSRQCCSCIHTPSLGPTSNRSCWRLPRKWRRNRSTAQRPTKRGSSRTLGN